MLNSVQVYKKFPEMLLKANLWNIMHGNVYYV